MKEWEKELYSYQLKPAPPKMSPQEYIERYLAEKDDKYFSWYLHYNEKYINEKVKGYVQEYATVLKRISPNSQIFSGTAVSIRHGSTSSRPAQNTVSAWNECG